MDPPVVFPRPGDLPRDAAAIELGSADIPDADPAGIDARMTVSGLGQRLFDVDVTVDVEHPRGQDLDLFLTSPAGTRIDLATDIGGGHPDLYRGTTFDDGAPAPVSDTEPPTAGSEEDPEPLPFTRVIPEGALGAFVGQDPNGTWTLTVADDAYGETGQLHGWSLRLVAQGPCGNGAVDPGEACDDGNGANGDGCDVDCSVSACGNGIKAPNEECDDGNTADEDGCSSQCHLPETLCDDCRDNDGDGLADAADPGCGATALTVRRSRLRTRKAQTKIVLRGAAPVPEKLVGPLTLILSDANGLAACGSVGELHRRGRKWLAKGSIAGGTVVAKITAKKGGTLLVKAKKLALPTFDASTATVAVSAGDYRVVTGGPLGQVR